jgi:hypothetical protein
MGDFATFLGVVKRPKRIYPYLTLAAMFVLAAHVTPVPAKKISDLLKLHLATTGDKSAGFALSPPGLAKAVALLKGMLSGSKVD